MFIPSTKGRSTQHPTCSFRRYVLLLPLLSIALSVAMYHYCLHYVSLLLLLSITLSVAIDFRQPRCAKTHC